MSTQPSVGVAVTAPSSQRRRSSRPALRAPVEILGGAAEGRRAMAGRHVDAVYRILVRHGYSQRRIGAMTGQSQSEISEILFGRQVVSVDVIERIADGLGTPRGWWRLAGHSDGLADELGREVEARRRAEHAALEANDRRVDAVRLVRKVCVAVGTVLTTLRELETALDQTHDGDQPAGNSATEPTVR